MLGNLELNTKFNAKIDYFRRFSLHYSGFSGSNDVEKLSKTLNDSSLNFKYSTIEKATGSFDSSNKLGQGGFGTVYKVVCLPSHIKISYNFSLCIFRKPLGH